MTALEEIKKALEGVTPDQVERLWWFLHIISKSGGATDATDDKWNWINAFCHDFEDDTFNRAADLGFISVLFDSMTETSTAKMTPAGSAFVSYFDNAPSASANASIESLQRENEELLAENGELRNIVSNCAAALMTGAFVSPKCSVDFMKDVPKEIASTVSAIRTLASTGGEHNAE